MHSKINKLIFSFEKYNGTYFRVPKVASTSLLMTFRKIDNVEKIESNVNNYSFKFAFVRNPFDRLVSAFKHLVKNGAKQRINDDPRLYRDMEFKEFVDVLLTMDKKTMDIHFRPQNLFLPNISELDFIGKFENINDDFIFVCKKLGIKSLSLMHQNSTNPIKLSEYYDEETIKKVSEFYKEDFELFNYNKTFK